MRRLPVLILLLAASCTSEPAPPTEAASVPAWRDGVMVHLFEWRWADVAEECETVLGPLGYEAVQVSPPTENHVIGGRPWFERYQPASYRIETRSGDRTAFADMVRRCDAAGVDVVVDAVLNHMADADLQHAELAFTGRGTAGTTFGSYEYPGLYGYDDFHHCGLTPGDDIADYQDPDQVRNCELVDLADLDTGSPKVRATLAGYLRDLASLGVRGIRIDAARHMDPADIRAILDSSWTGYVVSEVTEPDWTGPYAEMGDVTDFAYGALVSESFRDRRLDRLHGPESIWRRDPVSSERGLVFIDNHDKQRGHGDGDGVLTYQDDGLHDLAVAFMLAFDRGRPRVMSSYAFATSFQGPPTTDGEAIVPVHGPDGVGCGTEWVCEHRHPLVAGMVGFHRAVADAPMAAWTAEGTDRVHFARAGRGFVALNAGDGIWELAVDTGLPAGTYCDVAQGPPAADGTCAGTPVIVDGSGRASIAVPPMDAVALHLGAPAA